MGLRQKCVGCYCNSSSNHYHFGKEKAGSAKCLITFNFKINAPKKSSGFWTHLEVWILGAWILDWAFTLNRLRLLPQLLAPPMLVSATTSRKITDLAFHIIVVTCNYIFGEVCVRVRWRVFKCLKATPDLQHARAEIWIGLKGTFGSGNASLIIVTHSESYFTVLYCTAQGETGGTVHKIVSSVYITVLQSRFSVWFSLQCKKTKSLL